MDLSGDPRLQKRRSPFEDDLPVANKKVRNGDLAYLTTRDDVTSQQNQYPGWDSLMDDDVLVSSHWQDWQYYRLENGGDDAESQVDVQEAFLETGDLETPSNISDANDPQITSHEVCLGLIVLEVTSSFDKFENAEKVPVDIKLFGNSLEMKHRDSGEYVGLISNRGLFNMLENCQVRITASLNKSANASEKKSLIVRGEGNLIRRHCTVRVIVYAQKDDRQHIGDTLSQEDVYLQHPLASECELGVEYSNPHYLLRPGAELPRLEEMSLNEQVELNTAASALDDVWKSRVMRVFDDASFFMVQPSTSPSPRLKSSLNKHQLTALQFMIEKEMNKVEEQIFPQLWTPVMVASSGTMYRNVITGTTTDVPQPPQGGILADEMGLGKTLSMLALLCASLDQMQNLSDVESNDIPTQTLIVAPKSVLSNWTRQVDDHIKTGKISRLLYHGSSKNKSSDDLQRADIVLTTYETLRSEWIASGKLFTMNWYRVVLDEAHHIRNRKSQNFQAACSLKSQHRWCLTGTPIHNSIDDYGALLAFLRLIPLDQKAQFDHWIALPLKRDGSNSFRALRNAIQATCLRRTKAALDELIRLPLCIEKTEIVELDEDDHLLYEFFRKQTAGLARRDVASTFESLSPTRKSGHNLVTLLNCLRLICDHGLKLLPDSAIVTWKAREMMNLGRARRPKPLLASDGSNSIVNENGTPYLSLMPLSEELVSFGSHQSCDHIVGIKDQDAVTSSAEQVPTSMQLDTMKASPSAISPSAKVKALLKNITAEQAGDDGLNGGRVSKCVIFSFWTKMLDLIEPALVSRGLQFARIDGSTTLEVRNKVVHRFDTDPSCNILLASISSAGEGVNLTSADHVHLVEPHWNPMTEAQAIARIHRIGQLRETKVTRYIVRNSIEEYVQQVQKHKLRLISGSLGCETMTQKEIDQQRLQVCLQTSYEKAQQAELHNH